MIRPTRSCQHCISVWFQRCSISQPARGRAAPITPVFPTTEQGPHPSPAPMSQRAPASTHLFSCTSWMFSMPMALLLRELKGPDFFRVGLFPGTISDWKRVGLIGKRAPLTAGTARRPGFQRTPTTVRTHVHADVQGPALRGG